MGKPKNNWQEIVAAYHASGQSQKKWCAINDVNIHNLSYWLRKEKDTALSKETCQWIPLNISESETTTENQNITIKVGQVFIEVKPGFDPEFLTNVVKALITVC